jgi:MYXO-CTERM domain-containing protein
MFAGTTAHANLVTNGGFETGDFSGWTTAVDPPNDGVDVQSPQAGTYAAFFGNPGGISTISQTLTTLPGNFYDITFWVMVEADPTGASAPNSFAFDWGGVPVTGFANQGPSGYTEYEFKLAASTASTQLAFNFSDTPAFIDFDSVNVTAIPEPTSLALALGALGAALATRRRSSAKSEAAEGAG